MSAEVFTEIFDQLWVRPQSGFRWVDAVLWETKPAIGFQKEEGKKGKGRPVAVMMPTPGAKTRVLIPVSPSEMFEPYNPMERPGLFRELAALDRTKEAILAFANKHGDLDKVQVAVPGTVLGASHRHRVPVGEEEFSITMAFPFERWCDEIRRLQFLVGLFDAIAAKDVHKLGGWVHWGQDADRRAEVRFSGNLIASEKSNPSLMRFLQFGDVVQPARFYLAGQLSQQLENHCSPAVYYAPSEQRWVVRSVPDSLRAALWLQFALEFTEEQMLRQCPHCKKWFVVRGQATGAKARRGRSDKTYCSGSCRAAANRENLVRRNQIRAMLAENKTWKQIARVFGVDEETVQKWARSKKRKG